MKRIESKAPTRIDLAGGTIDLWPIHQLLENPMTVNFGISLFAKVSIELREKQDFELLSADFSKSVKGSFEDVVNSRELPLISYFLKHYWSSQWQGLRITTVAGSPPGAGLGGSSALAIALSAALVEARHQLHGVSKPDEHTLVATARDLEARIIFAPTGVQDYWGALRGGLNELCFLPGLTEVHTHREGVCFEELERELIVCYSGQSRASAINNWEIFKKLFDGDQQTHSSLQSIADCARTCARELRLGQLQNASEASRQEWDIRCGLWPGVETEVTKAISKNALSAGANLVRVCGAGGGGVMAILVDPSKRQKVLQSLALTDAKVLDAHLVKQGVEVQCL